jgi:phytoene dehydrogenase-like protein
MQTYDLVVIGSGPVGQRAAIQGAKLGKRVALVEKREVVGGACINTGTIPSKTMRVVRMVSSIPEQSDQKFNKDQHDHYKLKTVPLSRPYPVRDRFIKTVYDVELVSDRDLPLAQIESLGARRVGSRQIQVSD